MITQWILTGLALAAIIYNTIVTHVILKNDVKHLKEGLREVKQEMRDLHNLLMKK